ncbi:MAG TPA: hypothetical protein VFI70_00310 [Nitrososphaeraceae archaeon]|nr:hypothetical protein [Nitrososphaeraceae archaeon]
MIIRSNSFKQYKTLSSEAEETLRDNISRVRLANPTTAACALQFG